VALVAGPWYVYMVWHAPTQAGDFIWLHHLVRYVAPIDHEKPAWFYVPSLLLGMLPWTLLAVPMMPYLLRRSRRTGRRRPAALGIFVLAFVWCVVFFSLSGCKRPGYILPAFPLLALMLGTFVAHGLPWRNWATSMSPQRWARRLALTTAAMGITVSIAAAVSALWPWADAAAAGAIFLTLGIAVTFLPARLSGWTSWASCAAVVLVFLGLGQTFLLADYHERFGLRRQVDWSAEYEQDEELPILTYPKRWDSVGFYTKRGNVKSYAPAQLAQLRHDLHRHGRALLFVRRQGNLSEALAAVPEHLEVVQVGSRADYVAVCLVRPRSR
jgi:dolichol-phosphate mannosyltransferase